ncbi:YjfB family protein [Cohnella herbarum]|uniref:Putative motility protein n=1 Tax=Cohnella herbarum TaxID=2728023 RepID=A0A7Z2VQP1_9BACL|nr:YjfB family protein [Cohnella herbarum]QJD87165.1 putative motility protein [Cohnella herbarum]
MDISSLAQGVSSSAIGSLKNQVGVAVLDKSLDIAKQQGQQMVQLMEQSVQPHLGQSIDIKV